MYFLNIITWCVFIIPADALNDRISVTITIFLSELAFHLIISSVLPRVSYNTWFSLYFLVNYFSLALQSLEHVLSFELNQYVSKNSSLYTDYGFIAGFFVIHTFLLLLATHLSRKHNKIFKLAIAAETEALKLQEAQANSALQEQNNIAGDDLKED
eukprot:TRINITY_DN1590_c0_g1_i3.p1 TRINITY_DN1590_c0_g1~~TRINITY_DN1590_c0_g1_i3.p1  ORF type:complete len:156 (-),score=50.25 TRINITY_DN1590_c0_g1_i3:14-481(-)